MSDAPPDLSGLPDLTALAVFVATVDEGSLGAAARRVGIHQPNASRMMARLERQTGMILLERHPRGARPTPAGILFAAHARELLASAREFSDWLDHARREDVVEIRVGASMTIAEHLLPGWLAQLRERQPRARVDLTVQNSEQVLDGLHSGHLALGFVETPRLPGWVNHRIVDHDELVVVVGPDHRWSRRRRPLTRDELAATPLVVREGGSGTRSAFEALVDAELPEPAQVLASNAAVTVAVAAGAGPAVLSQLAVRHQVASGELVAVPVADVTMRRELCAVWTGPRHLTGTAGDLLAVATSRGRTRYQT